MVRFTVTVTLRGEIPLHEQPRQLLQSDPQVRVTVLDALTPAGNLANLEGLAEAHGAGENFSAACLCAP